MVQEGRLTGPGAGAGPEQATGECLLHEPMIELAQTSYS